MTKIPLRTVQKTIKRNKEGKGVEREAGSGRPRILQANDRRRVHQIALRNKYMSATKISHKAAQLGSPKVCQNTILTILREQKMFKFVPKVVGSLSERNIQKRVEWCLKYKDFDWTRVVFTDESNFLMYQYKQKVSAKKRPEKMVKKHPPSVGIWGGVCSFGTSIMTFYSGSVDSIKYINILNECLLEEMKALYGDEDWFLQQDNASCHVSRYSREELEKMGIKFIEWAPESPDLNVIEEI